MPDRISPGARKTLLDHLERVLVDPDALRSHLGRIRPGSPGLGEGMAEDEFAGVLGAILAHDRRLDLLDDEELRRLSGDGLLLRLLHEEIAADWWPAWNGPLSAVGRAFRERSGFDFSAPPPDRPEGEGEGEAVAALEGELVGSYGEAVEGPVPKGNRALVLRWSFQRTWRQLRPEAAPAEDLDPDRMVARFVLRGLARRSEQAGGWDLSIDGPLPGDDRSTLSLRLEGWGLRIADRTGPVDLGRGSVGVRLTGLGDPTGLFDGGEDGEAAVTIAAEGDQPWALAETVPGPAVDAGFRARWMVDPVDGLDRCIATVRKFLRTSDAEAVHEAISTAFLAVVRRRYVYRDFASHAEFTRYVIEAARNAHRDDLRRKKKEGAGGHDLDGEPGPGRTPQSEAGNAELRLALEGCLAQLPEAQRAVFRLRNDEGLSFAEIGERRGIGEGAARMAYHRARQRLEAMIRSRGYDEEDCGPGH